MIGIDGFTYTRELTGSRYCGARPQFAEWLESVYTYGTDCCDDEWSDGNGGDHVAQYGRRILWTTSAGFVGVTRFPTVSTAREVMVDVERMGGL